MVFEELFGLSGVVDSLAVDVSSATGARVSDVIGSLSLHAERASAVATARVREESLCIAETVVLEKCCVLGLMWPDWWEEASASTALTTRFSTRL